MADKENYYIPVEGKLVEGEKTVYTAYYKKSIPFFQGDNKLCRKDVREWSSS